MLKPGSKSYVRAMATMATAAFGSANRAAPRRFGGRAKTGGVLRQSPLPKTASPIPFSHRQRARILREYRAANTRLGTSLR
jgi:hypothetical protein